MTISHHSHSGSHCSHATGTLEEVVLKAIELGFTTYGLSEHIPRWRVKDLYPEEVSLGVAHLVKVFEEYLKEAWRLKAFYKDQINLLVGLETEFIESGSLVGLRELLDEHKDKIQYIVGSLHHVKEIPIDYSKELFDECLDSFAPLPSVPTSASSSAESTSEEKKNALFSSLFTWYFNSQLTLFETFHPEIIGHFDLCRLYYPLIDFRDYPSVWELIKRNIAYVVGYGGIFEVNAASFRKGWKSGYPGSEVFELILSMNGLFTLSDDSHGPAFVGLNYPLLYSYLSQQKLELLYYLSDTPAEGEDKWERGCTTRKIEGKPWDVKGDWRLLQGGN